MKSIPLKTCLAAACLAGSGLLAGGAQADIVTGDNPELVLVIWDPVAKSSYTRDLGLKAHDFWITAQQDAGSEIVYNLSRSTDPVFGHFQDFTLLSHQRWAVMAVDPGPGLQPGDRNIYTTLTQGPAEGVINPNWQDMTGMSKGQLQVSAQTLSENWIKALNTPDATAREFNSHYNGVAADPNLNGVSFDIEGWRSYIAKGNGFSARGNAAVVGDAVGGVYTPTNYVGQSSWFYKLTTSQDSSKVEVDEFDNLGANGYWGLGLTESGDYTLVYKLAAYDPKAKTSTAEGRARLSVTDFAAGFASRQISVPLNEFAVDGAVVSSVPEPATWGSFGLGLVALAGLVKRRRGR